MVRHVVWDWNGTLLDDLAVVAGATNDAFVSIGAPPVPVDAQRRAFRRPVGEYYADLLGRRLDSDEFARLDKVFHDSYRDRLATCALASDARDVLREWRGRGNSQSLLSMWFHDELVPLVTRYGLTEHFTRVDGLRVRPGGGPKAEHLVAHLAAIGIPAGDCVLIGDSVDDAEAAAAVGASSVLVTSGLTDPARLRLVGVPVADTLRAALALVG